MKKRLNFSTSISRKALVRCVTELHFSLLFERTFFSLVQELLISLFGYFPLFLVSFSVSYCHSPPLYRPYYPSGAALSGTTKKRTQASPSFLAFCRERCFWSNLFSFLVRYNGSEDGINKIEKKGKYKRARPAGPGSLFRLEVETATNRIRKGFSPYTICSTVCTLKFAQ